MDLGIGSDDELFVELKTRSLREHEVWRPKQCEPEECLFEEVSVDPVIDTTTYTTERAQVWSYQADFLYARRQFDHALALYRKGVAAVPTRYVLLRRLFIEGAARCCVHLAEHGQALQMAKLLLDESLTLEHRMTARSLLATVHAAAGNQQDAIGSLHICIQWQRSNVHFWLKLAEAYSALYRQPQPASHYHCTDHAQSCTTGTNCSKEPGPANQVGATCSGNSAFPHTCTSGATTRTTDIPSKNVGKCVCLKWYANKKDNRLPIQISNIDSCYHARNAYTYSSCLPTSHELLNPADTRMENSNEAFAEGTCGTSLDDKDLSFGDLLNQLDSLAITEQATSAELIDESTQGGLMCNQHRPILLAASCLLRARLLLKSVEHSVASFAKVKNSQLQMQIEQTLRTFHLDTAILEVLHHHARVIFRKGCHRLDEVTMAMEEGGRDDKGKDEASEEECLAMTEFEQRWFPWLVGFT
ncbi:uncharacterized protein C8orf76 homolog isoform X2 [Acanthaster planci]|uniref:Uncharacterized protein C8orf76 homolog isoform X2 n=1 Tax=Acanthaster planci TaxID=133434 RepID=A0A8B7ZRF2_ACAPL|nr:uncharacterized protein C8orf76 homolog isoform X2 [Acanthaster planci]